MALGIQSPTLTLVEQTSAFVPRNDVSILSSRKHLPSFRCIPGCDVNRNGLHMLLMHSENLWAEHVQELAQEIRLPMRGCGKLFGRL